MDTWLLQDRRTGWHKRQRTPQLLGGRGYRQIGICRRARRGHGGIPADSVGGAVVALVRIMRRVVYSTERLFNKNDLAVYHRRLYCYRCYARCPTYRPGLAFGVPSTLCLLSRRLEGTQRNISTSYLYVFVAYHRDRVIAPCQSAWTN